MRPSWNPLRCGGTVLHTNLLLMAKMIALCLLLTNHVRQIPDPWLPFVPVFDWIGAPAAFQRALQTVFVISAIALLFNRRVRLCCLLLGGSILIGVISSKAYYGNNKTFCGLILFLTGLYKPGQEPWLLRIQVAIVYFGAGLNTLLDADLAKLMSWVTIVTELGISAAFLVRKWFPLGILASVLFQSSLMLVSGTNFNMFFYATQAALLIFVDWPRSRWLVIYDGDCGFCNRSKESIERVDLEGLLDWRPYQSGAGRAYGISDADAAERLYLVAGSKIYSGFRAFRMMLLFNPVTYLAMAALIAAPPGDATLYRRIVVTGLLMFFLPAFAPAGEWVYRAIARNRYRLSANSACATTLER